MKKISLSLLVLTLSVCGMPIFAYAAAPVFETVSTNVSISNENMTCAKPTGTANGDLLLAFIIGYDDTVTITPPGGWTTVRGPDRRTGTNPISAQSFYKVAGASEGTDYSFNVSPGTYKLCAILRYSGANTSDPINAASSGNNGDSATRTGTGITTSENDETLVMLSVGYGGTPSAEPSGMTERALWDGVVAVYDETRSTAGATSDRTQGQSISDTWVTQMVAIKSSNPSLSSGRIMRLRGKVLLHGNVRLR